MTLIEWADRWGIPRSALQELAHAWSREVDPTAHGEAGVQQLVRLEAASMGWHLWRNNSGAGKIEDGRFIRWGLANDSMQLNRRLKSSDLIGWKPGGQFVARECKPPGWKYSPNDEHEAAQLAWLMLINKDGGDAAFATAPAAR